MQFVVAVQRQHRFALGFVGHQRLVALQNQRAPPFHGDQHRGLGGQQVGVGFQALRAHPVLAAQVDQRFQIGPVDHRHRVAAVLGLAGREPELLRRFQQLLLKQIGQHPLQMAGLLARQGDAGEQRFGAGHHQVHRPPGERFQRLAQAALARAVRAAFLEQHPGVGQCVLKCPRGQIDQC